jgi:predicted dehydrogenase
MPERVRVGIAGLGRFGRLHAGVLARLPDAEIVAICDPRAEDVTAVGDTYGVAGRYHDFATMLDHPGLDAVFIVTPEATHEVMAPLVIERGLTLFMEKPLATSAAKGRELLELAGAKQSILQIGFVLRFETQHAFLKAELDAGNFGEIVMARVKRNCTRDWIVDYGDRAHLVHETIIHDIDLLLWFFQSRCTSVYAVDRRISGYRNPDALMALLTFENGAVVTLETGWVVPQGAPANTLTENWHGTIDAELEIAGTKQSARFRGLETGLQIWSSSLVKSPDPGLWPEVHGAVSGALRAEDAHFIECVRTGRPSTVASVPDALEGLRIGEAIIASAASGEVVRL